MADKIYVTKSEDGTNFTFSSDALTAADARKIDETLMNNGFADRIVRGNAEAAPPPPPPPPSEENVEVLEDFYGEGSEGSIDL